MNPGYLSCGLKGGLEFTKESRSRLAAFSLDFSNTIDSSAFGYSVGVSYGEKSFGFGYPLFYACGNAHEVYACISPYRFLMGYTFPFAEIHFSGVYRLKRFLEFRIGPYIAYNGTRILKESNTVDGNFYSPSVPATMYKRLEFGPKAQLFLQIPIGKHFSIGANGSVGMSLNDLRKDKWEDAYAVFVGDAIYYYDWQSTKVCNRFYSFGLALGYAW